MTNEKSPGDEMAAKAANASEEWRSATEDLARSFTLPAWRAPFFHLPLVVTVESLHFMARRLDAQAEYLNALNHCTNMPEFVGAQSQFLRKATDDYGVETGRVMEEVRSAISRKAA